MINIIPSRIPAAWPAGALFAVSGFLGFVFVSSVFMFLGFEVLKEAAAGTGYIQALLYFMMRVGPCGFKAARSRAQQFPSA